MFHTTGNTTAVGFRPHEFRGQAIRRIPLPANRKTTHNHGKTDTQRRRNHDPFLGTGRLVRQRAARALCRTEAPFQYALHHGTGLEAKGFLSHRAYGNTYQYYPLVTEEQFRSGTLRGVISKYFHDSYLNAVSTLVREEKISVEELRELIERIEKGKE